MENNRNILVRYIHFFCLVENGAFNMVLQLDKHHTCVAVTYNFDIMFV